MDNTFNLSTGLVGIIVTVSTLVMFFLGALTASLVICLCYNPRRLKAPQTSTSTSGTTTSALPPAPGQGSVYEEIATEVTEPLEMRGNVAYETAKRLPMERNVAYETVPV